MLLRGFRIGGAAVAVLLLCAGFAAAAQTSAPTSPGSVVYDQPANPAGGLLLSSLRDPDGSDLDQWVWDGFVLPATQDVTEIQWLGGYDPARWGSGGRVFDFTVDIYASILSGTQPDLSGPPLVHEKVGSNAGETLGPLLDGVQMYGYTFVLPAPFHAASGVHYWVQIEGFQPGPVPDWGLAKGVGGDGFYFRRRAGEFVFQMMTGDTAFALVGPGATDYKLYLPLIFRG